MLEKPIPLKLIAFASLGAFVLGFLLFLHSLGSGGGVFAISLMAAGLIACITVIVIAIIRLLKRNKR
jgi:hypothetical protein